MTRSNCILFAGTSNQKLAELIAATDGNHILLGDIYHHSFPSKECYCQIKENIRGEDVFLLQSISEPANDNLMQLLVMADAARRASAGRITAVIPHFGYQRQDRKDKPRVPISAKLVMNLLESAGVDRIITMDLHAQQIQGFTDLPVDQLLFRPVLVEAMKGKNIQVIVAPDTGALKKAEDIAKHMHLDIAIICKRRKNDIEVELTQFVGDVKDKNVLIVDDLTESAGTLVNAAKCCRAQGASNVYCAVTHAAITDIGYTRLSAAKWDKVINDFYCSNTIMCNSKKWGAAIILDVAPLFAEAISRVHSNRSVSSLCE